MMPEAVPVTMVPRNGTFVKNLRKRILQLKKENSELQSDYHQLQQVNTYLPLDFPTFTSDRSNIIITKFKRTRMCSSIGNQTRTPYFWLRTIEHRTLKIVRPITSKQMFILLEMVLCKT